MTVNWRSLDIDNKGVFYTDANSYKIIKRDITVKKNYTVNLLNSITQVASYFFPVTAGIFIDDN